MTFRICRPLWDVVVVVMVIAMVIAVVVEIMEEGG